MREIRTSGSEGGGTEQSVLPTPIPARRTIAAGRLDALVAITSVSSDEAVTDSGRLVEWHVDLSQVGDPN